MRKNLCILEKELSSEGISSLEKNSCLFAGDTEDDIEVECGFCHENFLLGEKDFCPHCGNDIIIGRFDW